MPRSKNTRPKTKFLNPVKAKLAAGQSVIGVVICTNNVETAARAASLGFDFLWLEMEHSPLSLESVRNIVLATRGLPAVPIARPPVNELWTAKRLLDIGVLGVIFPFTSSPELARRAAAACRYPHAGRRGSGADLARFRWDGNGNYYDFADENVLVVAVVEDIPGLEQIDEIAATPGIDVIFIGTSDLSFALGLRGEQEHPRLEAAVSKIAMAAKKHKKFVGRPALTVEQVRRYQRQGFRFFMAGTELDFMASGAAAFLKPLGKSAVLGAAAGL